MLRESLLAAAVGSNDLNPRATAVSDAYREQSLKSSVLTTTTLKDATDKRWQHTMASGPRKFPEIAQPSPQSVRAGNNGTPSVSRRGLEGAPGADKLVRLQAISLVRRVTLSIGFNIRLGRKPQALGMQPAQQHQCNGFGIITNVQDKSRIPL